MPLLELRRLGVTFGGVTALDMVDMTIEKGEIHGLIGPNGAGKSTLFNAVTGVSRPTSGRVFFNGVEITGMKPFDVARAGIARTFQNLRLFNRMTVLDNLIVAGLCGKQTRFWGSLFGGRHTRREDHEISEKAVSILEMMGLWQLKDAFIGGLPYGKRKAVELARALATDPKIILLDEPGAGMNSEESEQVMDILTMIKKQGYTICLVEHDMRMVMELSDAITVIDFGKVIAEGSPEVVSNHERVIEAYLGR
jgi:branched-chain amino acid transport system ATP-binding protein